MQIVECGEPVAVIILHSAFHRLFSSFALLFALFVASCARAHPDVHAGQYAGAPVILISIDTLRADRLPVYGYAAGSTPVLDRLGREAVVFDDVYSHCPLTLPSHASLLTGLLPFHHGVRDNIGYALKNDQQTLASRFKAAGYATGGAVSAYVLRHQTGINRGFDFFDDGIEVAGTGESLSDSQRDGRLTVDALAGWIDGQSSGRVFAFLHLYEPHTPYTPPPAHRMPDPYDGEIAYADELVGRFLDRLNARGLLTRAIVAVVSDHGEGLNDHGEAEHGIFLYREALRVPWILRLPGGTLGGTRVAGTVGEVDVAATLLDLAGLSSTGIDGQPVTAALTAGRVEDRTVYSETWYPRLHFGWSDLASATEGRYRFIRAPRAELFDLTADPRERTNIADTRRQTASALGAWIERATAGSPVVEPGHVSADVRERLKALGYIGSSSSTSTRVPVGGLPDPKDTIASYEALKRAQAAAAAGQDDDAIVQFRRIVATNARMLDAWEALAKSLVRIGRTQEAIDAFGQVLALDPLKPETHLALARIFALERQPARARQHADLGVTRDPAAAYEVLAELAMDGGRLSDAAALARRSVDADPSRYMSHFLLGVVAAQQGRCGEAIDDFRRALDAKRAEPNAVVRNLHAGLADCFARTDRPAEAEKEFQAEIAAIPASPEAHVGLATLYRSQGRDAEARAVLDGLIASTPQPTADTYFAVVRAFSTLGDAAAARAWAAKAREKFPRDPRFR
jgi:arylsulfatase A-like enzyme/tetratricopeptide (TPR) repeat protein